MDHEHNEVKLQFFLHFGAASLVWFIYLPAIAFIALQDQFDEELDVLGQQINQLNDKEKVQRRLSKGEEKSKVNNSKRFGRVQQHKMDVPTSVLLDLTSSSEDEEDLMLKPP